MLFPVFIEDFSIENVSFVVCCKNSVNLQGFLEKYKDFSELEVLNFFDYETPSVWLFCKSSKRPIGTCILPQERTLKVKIDLLAFYQEQGLLKTFESNLLSLGLALFSEDFKLWGELVKEVSKIRKKRLLEKKDRREEEREAKERRKRKKEKKEDCSLIFNYEEEK